MLIVMVSWPDVVGGSAVPDFDVGGVPDVRGGVSLILPRELYKGQCCQINPGADVQVGMKTSRGGHQTLHYIKIHYTIQHYIILHYT